MSEVRRFLQRLVAHIRPGRVEADLTREIAAHLQLIEDELVARGMAPEAARAAAKRQFHGVQQTRELHRDARSFPWLAGWSMDLTLGVRMLRKTPGLTAIGVVALAVAIGAGTAYMEFVNDFFRPRLTFPGGDRLVGLLNHDPSKADVEPRSMYEFVAWKSRLTTIQDLGAMRSLDDNLSTADGRRDPVRGAAVSASAFRLVPAVPLYGRTLVNADERPDAPPVMVIGEDVWRARFAADPAIVGRVFTLGSSPRTVVGVMPSAFGFPINSSLWTPLGIDASGLARREGPAIRIFGRLRDDVTMAAARTELETIHAAVLVSEGNVNPVPTRPIVKPYVESLWSNASMKWQVTLLYSFNIFFLGLLGICAANIATLVFARTATREGELTVRAALGASRGRIVAQLVAEAVVLTAIAAIAGLWGATLALGRVREIFEEAQGAPMPFWWNDTLSVETVGYAALLVALASLFIGALPALKATTARMQPRLKEAGSVGGTMNFGRLWTGVIVMQIAVTVIFLLTLVSMGQEARQVHGQFAQVSLPKEEYLTAVTYLKDLDRTLTAAELDVARARERNALIEVHRRLNADPAIINATYAVHLPGLSPEELSLEFSEPAIAARLAPSGESIRVGGARVGANYFETFDQALIDGRTFTQTEIEQGRNVAVVDESFVRLVLGGQQPLGLLVRQPAKGSDPAPGPWYEIVGVVRDASTKRRKTATDAMVYRPFVPGDQFMKRVIVHSRATDVAARLRGAVNAADPELQLREVMTMDKLAEADWRMFRFFLSGLAVVAAVALLLSTAGIYALISFTLSRRTREIGIRLALGASARGIVTGLLSGAFIQVAIGVVLGGILGTAYLLAGADGTDSRAVGLALAATAGVGAFVVGIAMVSCVVPVRRALRVQPTQALRADG